MNSLLVAVLVALYAVLSNAAYYLPGVTPSSWDEGEVVMLKTNKVTSTKTPLQYDYYDLPFCKKHKKTKKSDNIGESLSGESVTESPYEVIYHYFLMFFLGTSFTDF